MATRQNRPTTTLDLPSFLKAANEGTRLIELTLSDLSDTNVLSTSSFKYDPRGEPLKSTQQLNVDWSKFENHTFFMPAEVKVNVGFDNIINQFPFDGTQLELEAFFDRLTGFEKWLYDQFPKNKGYLNFSGSWITVLDNGGGLFPELSKPRDGTSVLNPALSSFSIEGHFKIPTGSNTAQILCQKYDETTRSGFTLYLSPGPTSNCDINFVVSSGSKNAHVYAPFTKDVFHHVVAEADRTSGPCTLRLFSDGQELAVSRTSAQIGYMPIDLSPLTIGSGSSWYVTGTLTTPTTTFSGSIDDFRIFHSRRNTDIQQLYSTRGIYASPELKLYYKFNEPTGSLSTNASSAVNSIVIDSSGNGLHSIIQNFTSSLRVSYDVDPTGPMSAEREDLSPVLFPSHDALVTLNEDLLSSASLYDEANPNIITNLIPKHYLLEGQFFDGLNSMQGDISEQYTENPNQEGSGQLGSTQIILTFLYTYAKFFDELKLFVDQFVNLKHTNYSGIESVPNTFLYSLARQFGFDLPPLFNEASVQQYVTGDNINGVSAGILSLRDVQDQLMRRILVNLPKIIRSKGTLYSVKAFLRSVGIDPDTSVKIREYGGPTSQDISFSREERFEPGVMAAFTTSSLAITPYLSGSRTEPGAPDISGIFVNKGSNPPHGISNQQSDGIFTSGSWTWEGVYRWTPASMNANDWQSTQSLVRFAVTGSNTSQGGIVANLTATSGSGNSTLKLHLRLGATGSAPYQVVQLNIPSSSIFDNDMWNVSFGCVEPVEAGGTVSSSYFLRAGKKDDLGTVEQYVTQSYFYEGTLNALRQLNTSSNVYGPFIVIGQAHQIISGTTSTDTGHLFLNNTTVSPSEARTTYFTGRIGPARFWSKAISTDEWREHIRNPRSAGVYDPLTNYNFVTTSSGSFGRLRLESFVKQDVRTSTGGNIYFLDTSLNNNHFTGSGFNTTSNILVGETFSVNQLSPNFDEGSSNEKVRVRGYQSPDLILDKPWASTAPVYEVRKSERPTDDTRFVIEFSLIDALNRDIITIFSSFDSLEDAMGAPENAFSPEYPKLRRLSDVYFNKISDKLNFRQFFDFYRWFDTSIGTFIEQLIPRKTNFRGTNFTIESHMLERHKVQYFFNEMYLAQDERQQIRDVLLLQQIVGSCGKY